MQPRSAFSFQMICFCLQASHTFSTRTDFATVSKALSDADLDSSLSRRLEELVVENEALKAENEALRKKWSQRITDGDNVTMLTESRGECDGAYTIPNYLINDPNEKTKQRLKRLSVLAEAWKYGIPPGTKVTLKRDLTSSMNQWLHGKRGVVVADKGGMGLVPDFLDDRREEVCYFSGYIHFDDVPDGNLGQKNRFMYETSLGDHVYGIQMLKFTVKDVSIEPESLEVNIEIGYKALGSQLDKSFAHEILNDVLKPVEIVHDTMGDSVVSDSQIQKEVSPMMPTLPLMDIDEAKFVIKPEILTEVAELIPDSQLLQPLQPIMEARLKKNNVTSIVDSVVAERVEPLLHVIDVGQLAKPDELILDSIVRTIALPPSSPKDPPQSGKKVGQACKAVSMEDVKECCQKVTSKFWIIDCCWHACHKLFTDEQGVCMDECKAGRVA